MASTPRAPREHPEPPRPEPSSREARPRPTYPPRRIPTIVYLNLDLVAFWLVN
jgi:hypothetical protein